MDHEQSSSISGGFEVSVGLEFHKAIDYDRRAMRRALNQGAAEVRKEARRLVARRAVSAAGEFPGVDSGTLRRAIGVVKRGSKGGWVKIGVRKIAGMDDFYPAFLFYGSPKTRLAKRGNYITAALATKRETVRSNIRGALKDCLVPR
jgi:hypothetical protein